MLKNDSNPKLVQLPICFGENIATEMGNINESKYQWDVELRFISRTTYGYKYIVLLSIMHHGVVGMPLLYE